VLRAYRRLLEVESSFRVLKNFIALRPVYHWTEDRVRAHVAVCVLGALIEALIEADLRRGDVRDPDLPDQVLSPRRALRELAASERHHRRRRPQDRRRHPAQPLQSKVLAALGVDTSAWDRARVS
jgi:Transposase